MTPGGAGNEKTPKPFFQQTKMITRFLGHAWRDRGTVETITHWLASHGYLAVGTTIALESLGLPLPGEAAIIAIAAYAATSHQLNIWWVFATCAAGAALGSTAGYVIGRKLGYWVLLRHGRHVGVTERRMRIAQLLFHLFGGAIIFFARFVAVFRSLAALFAGANRMGWLRFTIFNLAGAIAWSAVFAFGTFYFADVVKQWSERVALIAGAIAAIAIIGGLIWTHGHEGELEERAKQKLESEDRKRKPRNRTVRSRA